MEQAQAFINFECYEDSVNLLGIAKIKLPDISWLTQQMQGAGIAGKYDAVLIGLMDAMELGLDFLSVTDDVVSLLAPKKHHIDLRAAQQYWDTVQVEQLVQADKYVLVVVPKSLSGGTVGPANPAEASGKYAVYRYEAYKDGKELWLLDPLNYICRVGGVDYLEPVRKALGK